MCSSDLLTVKALVKSRQQNVIELSAEVDPIKNFQTLIANRILSAPVRTKTGKYIGFLDIRDLVCCVIFRMRHDRTAKKVEEAGKIVAIENKRNSLTGGRRLSLFEPDRLSAALEVYKLKFQAESVKGPSLTTSYLCKRNRFVTVEPDDHIQTLLCKLLEKDVRRVAVIVPGEDAVSSIISQSDVLQFFHTNESQLAGVVNKTVDELKVGTSPVITCDTTDSVATVFEKMDQKNIGGLAVVEAETGQAVSNVSASDIKLFLKRKDRSALLESSVVDFVSDMRKGTPKAVEGVVSVTQQDTLAKVIALLAATRFHHLFVLDAQKRPVTVISLRDVIKAVRHWVSLAPVAAAVFDS